MRCPPELGERHTEQCGNPSDQPASPIPGSQQCRPFDRHRSYKGVACQRFQRCIQDPATDCRLNDDTRVHPLCCADVVIALADLDRRQPSEKRAQECDHENHEHPQPPLAETAGGHEESHARRLRISSRSMRINIGTTTRPTAVVSAIDQPALTQ